MAHATEALQRAASGEADQARGTVRITASEIVGSEILPHILTKFRERYPGVVVEVMLSNRSEDLLHREADIAVRMVRPTQTALVARKVGVVGSACMPIVPTWSGTVCRSRSIRSAGTR